MSHASARRRMEPPQVRRATTTAVGTAAMIVAAGCTAVAPGQAAGPGALVLTLVPADNYAVPADRLDVDGRYPAGSRIALVSGASLEATDRTLSGGLTAAGAPDVSPGADTVLFTGLAEAGSRWSIYETDLAKTTPRAIVTGDRNCVDPAYLAGDRIVFACDGVSEPPLASHGAWSLFVARLDGSEIERITFGPGSAFDPTPLHDGRILFVMERVGADGSLTRGTDLFTVNPDGTLLEPFTDRHGEPQLRYEPRQAADGRVVFLVPDHVGSRPWRWTVDVNRPTARPQPLPADVAPSTGMIRAKASVETPRIAGMRTIEAVRIEPRRPPRGRPRLVDPDSETGLLLGYDAALSDGIVGPPPGSAAPLRIRVASWVGRAHTLMPTGAGISVPHTPEPKGSDEAPIHADRSFFLEVPADVPIQLTTLDGAGAPIATSGWFWVRRGEVRACFGCHESRTRAPVNRVIDALAQAPDRVWPRGRGVSSPGGTNPRVPSLSGPATTSSGAR